MLNRLRELLAEATPGAWATNGTRVESRDDHGWINDGWIIGDLDGPDATNNAALIVAAHNALPALLDVVEAAKAMRDADNAFPAPGSFSDLTEAAIRLDAALKRLEGGE